MSNKIVQVRGADNQAMRNPAYKLALHPLSMHELDRVSGGGGDHDGPFGPPICPTTHPEATWLAHDDCSRG